MSLHTACNPGQNNSMQFAMNPRSTMATQLVDLPVELLVHLVSFAECPCDVINAGRTCRTLRAMANTFLADNAARVAHPVPRPALAGCRASLPTMSVRMVMALTELEQKLIVRCAGRVVSCNTHNPGDPRNFDLLWRASSQLAPPTVMHCFPDWSSVRALVLDFRSATDWKLRTKSGRRTTGIESLASLDALSNVTHLTLYSTQGCLDQVLALLDRLSGQLQHLNFRDASIGEFDLSSYQFPRLRSLYINLLGVVELPKSLPALVLFDCYALHPESIFARLVRCAPRIASVYFRGPFGFDRPSVGFGHLASASAFVSDSDSDPSSSSEVEDPDSDTDLTLPPALSQRIWSTIDLPFSLSHLSLPPTIRLSKLALSPHVTDLEISGHNRLTPATVDKFPNLTILSTPELTFTAIKALQQASFASTLTHLTIREAIFDLIHTNPAPLLRLPNLVHVHADQDMFLSTNLDAPNLTSTILDLQGARDAHPTVLARILASYPRLSRVKIEWFGAWARERPPQLTFVLPHHEQQELGLDACPTAVALAGQLTNLDIPAGFMYLMPDCRGLHELIVRVPSLNPRLDTHKWAEAVAGGALFPKLTAMTLVVAQATDDNPPIQVDPNSILTIALSPACPRLVSFSVHGSLHLASHAAAAPSKAPLSIAWNGALSKWQWSAVIGRLCGAPGWNTAVQQRTARSGVRVCVADPARVDAQGMLDGLAKIVGHGFREKLSVVQRKGVGKIAFEIVGPGIGEGGLSDVLEKLKRCHYPTTVVTL